MDPSQIPPGLSPEDIPAGPPPSGTFPNFENPVTLKDPIVTVYVTLLIVTKLFVGLRLYTNHFLNRVLRVPDYVCLLALLGSITHSGLVLYLVNHGLGKHIWDIRVITLTACVARVINASRFTYAPVIFLVRLSVLILYYNIFGVNKTMKRLIYLGIGFAAIYCVAVTGYNIAAQVTCIHVAAVPNPICINNWVVTITSGAVNTSIDIYILILPISKALQLQLTTRRKLGVISIFAIGLLAVIASLVRLIITAQRGHSSDVFWDAGLTSICNCVEMNGGILCTSMPAMPMFFRQTTFGMRILNTLEYRLFGKPVDGSSTIQRPPAKQGSSKGKLFRGISFNMTSPSVGMKSSPGSTSEECVELEEGHDRKRPVVDRTA